MGRDPLKYYPWEFTIKDGRTIIAKFTDKEILEMKKLYPEIKWSDNVQD